MIDSWADDNYRAWLQVLRDANATEEDLLDAAEKFRNSAQRDWRRPAGDPRWYDDEAALDALTELASGDREPNLAAPSAAETLVTVWLQKGSVDIHRFKRLADPAKAEVLAYPELNRPDLLDGLA